MTEARLAECLKSAREARESDTAMRMTHDAFLAAKRRYLAGQTEANYDAYWRARRAFLDAWGAADAA